jgi:alpha-amylase/alpha-mannosidase (GH57 family)
MERYICIHGHFYQPPRENPWLELVELQDSAAPYHDWNKRITTECYATNAKSRILDNRGRITKIVNNYSKISFNFGPTLLAWLEKEEPNVYMAILRADQESLQRFSEHGSALAQVYNHMILPLANTRDKVIQIRWGLLDFEYRFRRKPEGMWLPETAVDLETLDLLAAEGILYTILAPDQAKSIRPLGAPAWQDVRGGKIDPTMPYLLNLSSGRKINIFFYDKYIALAVAFDRLLQNGETFAQRLAAGFNAQRTWPQIVHIATDGESYGHHHQFGDMALAYALDAIESENLARLTNYGEYLVKHPATHEVEIIANTSWSCSHGIERWRSHCGCSTGAHPIWNQHWRKPLRETLDWLRDGLLQPFEQKGRDFFKDPWAARNDYIKVILDRSEKSIEAFFQLHAVRSLNPDERIFALKLLELQRHALLMFTSCGWFFDDISGIETIQLLQYAGRAMQLASELFNLDLEPEFRNRMKQALSNAPDYKDGSRIYEKFVKPSMIDMKKACVHYAVKSLFIEDPGLNEIGSYLIEREDYHCAVAGSAKIITGKVKVKSQITLETLQLHFGILHLGDHNIKCGVHEFRDEHDDRELQEILQTFQKADLPESLRLLDRHFGSATYSIKSLYRDEQRRILRLILKNTIKDLESVYRKLYEQHSPIMFFLKDSNVPAPRFLTVTAELVINADLRLAFRAEEPDAALIDRLERTAKSLDVLLENEIHEFIFRRTLERMAARFLKNPADRRLLEKLVETLDLASRLPFTVNLWNIQNTCYEILQSPAFAGFKQSAAEGQAEAQKWLKAFCALGEKLMVFVSS